MQFNIDGFHSIFNIETGGLKDHVM